MFALLVAAFVFQTWLVYSDSSGRETPPLSPLADQGQRLWHQHNCQSCHQIYGFGGFLGPDLTNAIGSLTEARLRLILTEGAGRMPAFGLDAGERSALQQFFVELDRTGVSQARHEPPRPPDELLDHLVELVTERGTPLTASQTRGLEIVRREKCVACHLPNAANPVRAPDLSTAVGRLGSARVHEVLEKGVPGTVMPRFEMSMADRESVLAFLAWMESRPDTVARVFSVTRGDGASAWSIPWFEFE